MVVENKLYTVAEFEQFITLPENRDRSFELIDGEIVEKPMPTQVHGRIGGIINGEWYIYLKQNPIGFSEIEVRHRVPGDDHNSRQPDVSFFGDTVTPAVAKGAVPRMPDIAVEIKSPDDTFKELREKAAYYIANGTRIVWLVYPEQRLVEVYRPDADSQLLTERDTLDGGDVLPGFTLPVSTIFKV